jgi:hypothetical protein
MRCVQFNAVMAGIGMARPTFPHHLGQNGDLFMFFSLDRVAVLVAAHLGTSDNTGGISNR